MFYQLTIKQNKKLIMQLMHCLNAVLSICFYMSVKVHFTAFYCNVYLPVIAKVGLFFFNDVSISVGKIVNTESLQCRMSTLEGNDNEWFLKRKKNPKIHRQKLQGH